MRAVTSASNIFRRKLCPGSGIAEMGILDEESPYSAEGDLLHKLTLARLSKAAAPAPAGIILTPEQSETLNEAERLFVQFQERVMRQYGISEDEPFEDECEQTLIVRGDGGRELYPGHGDIIRTWAGAGVRLIADWKFGFLEVEEAPDNTQLASYGVAKYDAAPILDTAVAIIQPRAFGPRLTMAVYAPDTIDAARTELERIDTSWRIPGAPRIPGARQCGNCKAKLFCDKFKAQMLPATQGVRDVSLASNLDLERLHVAIQAVGQIENKVKAEMRRRIREGEMPGWELQNTGSTKTVPDLSAAYRRVAAFFPGEEALADKFMRCLKPTWEDLTGLAIDLTGLPQKKARAKLEEMLAGLIEETPKEPTPKRL